VEDGVYEAQGGQAPAQLPVNSVRKEKPGVLINADHHHDTEGSPEEKPPSRALGRKGRLFHFCILSRKSI